MGQQEDTGPGWEMQEFALERERMAREALERCARAGAKAEDLKLLASECGITNYTPKELEREQIKSN